MGKLHTLGGIIMVLQSVILGTCRYFGKTATAIREMRDDGVWRFILIVDGERLPMVTY